jgi:hypothetical protein
MSLSQEAQKGPPQNREMGAEVSSSRPNGIQPACGEELTRDKVLEWLDRLRIFEPTRSRLANLAWISNAGYLRSWTAWYGRQSACGVGWVIRQIEAGLQVPSGQEDHSWERVGCCSTKYTGDHDASTDLQEPRCAVQEEHPGNGNKSAVQPWQDLWSQALGELRLQMTGAAFDTWLAASRALGRQDERLVVAVRNQYAKEWLDVRFRPVVLRVLTGIDATISQVEFRVLSREETVAMY